MTSLSRDLTQVEASIDVKMREVVTSQIESKRIIEQKVEEVVEHVRSQPPQQPMQTSFFTHLDEFHSERLSDGGGRLSLIDELSIRLASELSNRNQSRLSESVNEGEIRFTSEHRQ